MPRLIGCALLAATAVAFSTPPTLLAQWLHYPTPGIPRTPDGKPDLMAATPRTPGGKPDFSGMWLTADGMTCEERDNRFLECGAELPFSRYGVDINKGVPGGLPYRSETLEIVKKRMAEEGKDDPHARCLPDTFLRSYGLPHIHKIIQLPNLLVVLNEDKASYRQVFVDGRTLPDDPNPAWNGYSSARWDGDTLVIESAGFRDDLWLDVAGNFITSAARIRERISRPSFGYLLIEATVDDPKAYTRPWTINLRQKIVVDTELIEEICLENEKSSERMRGNTAPSEPGAGAGPQAAVTTETAMWPIASPSSRRHSP